MRFGQHKHSQHDVPPHSDRQCIIYRTQIDRLTMHYVSIALLCYVVSISSAFQPVPSSIIIQPPSNNNNIKAGYIGIHNKLNSIDLETRMSFSRNFGSSNHTLGELGVADQFSMGIKAQIPAPKLHGIINFNVGIEHGDLIYDNYGIYASFKRIWK